MPQERSFAGLCLGITAEAGRVAGWGAGSVGVDLFEE